MSSGADPARALGVVASVPQTRHSQGGKLERAVDLIDEQPLALVFNGSTVAVMMVTPASLTDFAIGFALTEGFIRDPAEIAQLEIIEQPLGIEARFWLSDAAHARLEGRLRQLRGPVGCGLCGVESLEAAQRSIAPVSKGAQLSPEDIAAAIQQLRQFQPLHDRTRAAHAAGFYVPGKGVIAAREDVGRHNALDKLIGAMVQANVAACSGAVVMTSRVSLELVEKCAIWGASTLIAASRPTALALGSARRVGLTLITSAGPEGFDLFD
ncbi:MAG: formate dehydrogenase accessory sulfurtransferase FdhD [Neomegalonema sp.]|nr:formate dehydrogenase accessory sulfurtransferase FdhD [Neomegalonema sp.]